MKRSLVMVLLQGLCSASLAQPLPLEDLGVPLHRTNLNVVWSAPTNEVPSNFWVYRVLPSEFSPTAISNLMMLGGFSAKDRANILGRPSSDPDALFFASPDGSRKLTVNPRRGFIEYRDETADDLKISEGVPKDDNATLQLAVNVLDKLGIKRSELATKPNSSDFRNYFTLAEATQYDAAGPAIATNIHMRGVFFIRKIDGVDFMGNGLRGGCEISFGHHAKVCRILLVWRQFEPWKSFPTVSPETLVRWVREGKSVWTPPPDRDYIDWSSAKSVTITKLEALYYGADRRITQDWSVPFATLETSVQIGETNLLVYIHCPIIDQSKSSDAKSPSR